MSTKDIILEMFEKNRGLYISGEKIANELNISRTAVWKAVKGLQKEGYEIKATTNRGYCLSKDSDVLSVQEITMHLSDGCESLRPEVFLSVDSTNNICRKKAALGEAEGYVAVAGGQTAGRGRRGHEFFSPAGTGVYLSILLRPEKYRGGMVFSLTTMAAVAVCEAIEAVSGRNAVIKWVNDILIDGKKVGGILSEASYAIEDGEVESAIVGIGINAYPPKDGFPDSIADTAGSIFDKTSSGRRSALAAEILNRFMAYYNKGAANDHFREYERRSVVLGRDIRVVKGDRVIAAPATGLDENCGLIVRYDDGSTETLKSGEVSIRGKDF